MNRTRSLRRSALFVALVAVLVGVSLASADASRSAFQALPPGATIIAGVPVPNDGPVTIGQGSVWVVVREGGALRNGVPLGRLYRIDPRTVRLKDVIPHVTGGSATVADGMVWISSFVLDRLLRVDPVSHRVTRIKTGPDDQPGTLNILSAAGKLWVTNHHDGTVAVVDPATSQVTATVPVFRTGCCGAQALTTDGTSVWVTIPGADLSESAIVRIDAAAHTVTSTFTGVPDGPCGGLAIAVGKLWSTASDCDGQGVMKVDPVTNTLADYFHRAGVPGDVLSAFGSIWIATRDPDALVRIDPMTDAVVGSLPLPADTWNMAADSNRLWVRVQGAVLDIAPQ